MVDIPQHWLNWQVSQPASQPASQSVSQYILPSQINLIFTTYTNANSLNLKIVGKNQLTKKLTDVQPILTNV